MNAQAPKIGATKSEDVQRLEYITQALMPDAAVKMAVVSNIAILILGWLSLSLEVFIRREFGERYLGYLRLAFTGFLLAIYLGFLTLFSSATAYGNAPRSAGSGPLEAVFLLAFMGMAMYHRVRIWRKKRAGVQWHSMSFGVSRLAALPAFQTANDWALYRAWEPLAFFVLGTVITAIFHSTIGTWMQVASVALAVKNQLVFAQQYSRILDMIDGRIEAEFFNEAAQGKPKTQTAGFSVVPANYDTLVSAAPLDMVKTVRETLRPASGSSQTANPNPALNTFADTVRDTMTAPREQRPSDQDSALRRRHEQRRR